MKMNETKEERILNGLQYLVLELDNSKTRVLNKKVVEKMLEVIYNIKKEITGNDFSSN